MDRKNQNAMLTEYRLQRSEYAAKHHSYALEKTLRPMLISGNIEELISLIESFPRESMGKMSDSPEKQEEYAAVLAISMLVRVAIEEGLDPMEAYALNDLYLQRVSASASIRQIRAVLPDAFRAVNFALRRSISSRSKSVHVERAKQFIAQNLTRKITLKEIADYAGLSPNRLSAVFSQTEQKTLKTYILEKRVDAAKDMLKYSAQPIGTIAATLCFSSQSHFGAVFHNLTGMTPSQFRLEKFVP